MDLGVPPMRARVVSAAALLLAALASPGQSQSSYYPVAIDQDRLAGPADFSFLNRPLTAADRLFARAGGFYRAGPDLQPDTSADGRVRLFGINLAFDANFPQTADAARVARRLRKLGSSPLR